MGNNVTFDEMNELLDEINRSGGETWVEIDGQTYYTDWGYGVVAIEFFIRMLKNRKSDSDATLVRHDVAEHARFLIDDEVHRDCEYYVYSQLRDCIDAIDDDYERLNADNAKLRELVRDMWRFTGTACKKYPRLFDPAAQGGQTVQLNAIDAFEQRMRELGIEVDE